MSPSPNTGIQPVSFQPPTEGADATIAGISFEQLAHEYGTPLYIVDELTIRRVIESYKKAFENYSKQVTILFASKAFCTMGICALAKQEGLGMDVVSGGELHTALQAGFPSERLLFNGNNKTHEELTQAIHHEVGHISVDNFYELEQVHTIAAQQEKTVPILLRIAPGIECHTHDYIKTGHLDSKFGFELKQLSAAIDKIATDYKDTVTLQGLHAHIGSQIFETKPYHDLIEVMLNIYFNVQKEYGITMTHLNLGGGLGVAYQDGDDPPDVSEYATVILDHLQAYAQQIDFPLPALFLEPGRSLIATAGMTLYTVGSTKSIPELNKTYVAVDGGMGDNIRPALYQAEYSAVVVNKYNDPHTKPVTIAGKYCESGDILLKSFNAPDDIEAGDRLLVFGTGAYNYTMASHYNRVPKPAVVLVHDGKSDVLVKRETYDDLIGFDCIPEHLKS